ncbi:hypothetical protein D9M68_42480 [compost metagenome]
MQELTKTVFHGFHVPRRENSATLEAIQIRWLKISLGTSAREPRFYPDCQAPQLEGCWKRLIRQNNLWPLWSRLRGSTEALQATYTHHRPGLNL